MYVAHNAFYLACILSGCDMSTGFLYEYMRDMRDMTNNIDVVNYCRMQFNFELPSVTIAQRSRKFADKYRLCDNALCKSFVFR